MQESLLNTQTNFSLLKYTNQRKGALFCLRLLVSYSHPVICTELTRMDITTVFFICSTRTDNGVVIGGRWYMKRVSIRKKIKVVVLTKFEIT